MAEPLKEKDPWRFPVFGLWLLILMIGLIPEPVYYLMRFAGGVVSQRALVNSPYMITIALAVWVMLFVFYACVRCGLSPLQAQDRALQLAVLALVAFLPVDLPTLLTAHSNPLMRARFAIYLAGLTKLLAWWFLLNLIVRYYLLQMEDVFARIPSLFPSARTNEGEKPTNEGRQSAPTNDPTSSSSNNESEQ